MPSERKSAGEGGPKKQAINYAAERVIGNGSFGVVYQATVIETGETVAIKKVLQDRRFKVVCIILHFDFRFHLSLESGAANHGTAGSSVHCVFEALFLLKRR